MRRNLLRGLIYLLAVGVVGAAFINSGAKAADYKPNPQTDYAKTFVSSCSGEEWFLNEVERILNEKQSSLDYVKSSADLSAVKSIGLKNMGIAGKIPEAIGELKELRYLFLSGNKLKGTIPPALFSLAKLENADLSGNEFKGEIPAEFGTMPALKALNLGNNQLAGTIPQAILTNGKITVLNVGGNRLNSSIPADLSKMFSLKFLNISNNEWTKGPLPDFSKLTKLEVLSAWSRGLQGEIPAYIYNMTNLQALDLAGNELTGEIPDKIGALTNLELLSLGDNKMSGELPAELGSLPKLAEIDISNNSFRGTLPNSLTNKIKGGSRGYFQNNYLTGDSLKNLPNNENNFVDGSATAQFGLTTNEYVQISLTKAIDVYKFLKNAGVNNSNKTEKTLLSADLYTVKTAAEDANKVSVKQSAEGIMLTALAAIPKQEAVKLTIGILSNDGSEYSQVELKLTTDFVSKKAENTDNGGGSGGSGGVPLAGIVANTTSGVNQIIHEAYIGGYPDGAFKPEESVSREEIAKMIVTAKNIVLKSSYGTSYADVEDSRWSKGYIAEAAEAGFLLGYSGGSFKPAEKMSRAELASCLSRMAEAENFKGVDKGLSFTDVPRDAWYEEGIRKATNYGLTGGYLDGSFKPNASVTRAEAVAMLNRALGRSGEIPADLKEKAIPFKDITGKHWAYEQIMEAAVRHSH